VGTFDLATALRHVAEADGGCLAPIVAEFGVPSYFDEQAEEAGADPRMAPVNTFHSLCRIVVGQQLAGAAVRSIWARFVQTLGGELSAITPELVLAQDLEEMRASAGLSGAKARAIVDLAQHYATGKLSDGALLDPTLSTDELAAKLLAVKGIGPWSANMYQLFSLHMPDVFPIGDLGVRNGMAIAFGLRGSGKNGAASAVPACSSLAAEKAKPCRSSPLLHTGALASVVCAGSPDEKKDGPRLHAAMEPYRPYRSVVSWYMWKVVNTGWDQCSVGSDWVAGRAPVAPP
jgi:DNA-3-methyladenine glycosylase II